MAADVLALLIKTNLAAAAAIITVLALRRMTRRAFGARVAYALWLAVPLAVGASLLPARVVVLPYVAPLQPTADVAGSYVPTGVIASTAAPSPLIDNAAVIALWLAGAAVSFAFLAWSQSRFMKSLGGVEREGQFLRARACGAGPAVVGALVPRIVLPADFETRYEPAEQKVVLAHEAAHLAAGDAGVNALIALAQCLFWFNPLIHLAARTVRVDQELACDAAVLCAYPQMRRPYAEALLKTQIAAAPLPLGCYWPAGASNPLKERIAMLTLQSPSRARRLLGGGAVLALCLGAGAATWAAQPATVTLAPARAAAPARLAPAAQPVQVDQMTTSMVTPAAIAASDTGVDVADNQPVTPTQLVTTDGGRTFQRVNAPPSPVSPNRNTLMVMTGDGRPRTFILMQPHLKPPSYGPKPAWWKPVPLEQLAETEEVRQAQAVIAAAVAEQDARLVSGRPPQPLTPQLAAALAIVPKFYRDAAQRDIEITRLELRQMREYHLASMAQAIARAGDDPVERQKQIELRDRYLARFPSDY